MELSREAVLVSGISLLSVPAILYGGVTLLGVVTGGSAGLDPVVITAVGLLRRSGRARAGG